MIVCLKEKLPSCFPLINLVNCCKPLACQHLMNIKHDMEAQQRTSTCVAHRCICLNFTFSGLVQTNWDHVFSRLSTSTKSDICTFASKPDNVCTHCNRDCILFAQILKKALPTHMLSRWSPHNWSFVCLEDNAKGCVRRCGKNHILGVSSCFT